jgi:hypothetical protein
MRLRICGLLRAALIGGLLSAAAQAATPAEDASAATRRWAKAVMELDVDTQMSLLPKKLFASPERAEIERKARLHEKERAIVNREKYLSFDVDATTGLTGKVGNVVIMVFPYRSVMTVREGKLMKKSSLIAVAEEGSSNWSVLDGTGQNPRSMKIFVPGYAGTPAVPTAESKIVKAE